MQDNEIVELFWQRNQSAILHCGAKYGKSLEHTSFCILKSEEDAKECVQDTYFTAWNSMPSDRPIYLGAYLAKIIRALSIDKFRSKHSKRRGGFEELCEELDECIPSEDEPLDAHFERERLRRVLSDFLRELDAQTRVLFVRRYVYFETPAELAQRFSVSANNVNVKLHRARKKLQKILEKEGFAQ